MCKLASFIGASKCAANLEAASNPEFQAYRKYTYPEFRLSVYLFVLYFLDTPCNFDLNLFEIIPS